MSGRLNSFHLISACFSSSQLFSAHVSSSHVFAPLLTSSKLFSALLTSSQMISALLSSCQLFSPHLSSSQRTLRSSQLFLAQNLIPAPKPQKVRFKRRMERAENEKTSPKTNCCNFGATIPLPFAGSKLQKTMELCAQQQRRATVAQTP